ncbi:uncharacterized protein BCR38DRAFT_487618 [Pseudomassariella vexata]|uniref:Mid2 domain-containing protein n=1 Tax=Pseudomassariella vexata TaxID=1141098 RepID=A0A1Y2DPF8_9PEZI|nr:uncharacterized protein BCR38DRAFT_487618 [Pseudomassariella vexata]ORY60555.1 hypothetical protein BCR38DRAFT_487618 [Pseudomassariella vexata]
MLVNARTIQWILKCTPRNDSSCCLEGADTCCDDETNRFKYRPGAIVALLDPEGDDRLVQSPTSSENSTATPSSGSDPASSSENKGAIIGLGVALGTVVLASAIALAVLWRKLAAERKGREQADGNMGGQGHHLSSQNTPSQYTATDPNYGQRKPENQPLPGTVGPPLQLQTHRDTTELPEMR